MCKRKFDSEDASEDRSAKQLKLVPFPNYTQADMDVDMSDSSSSTPYTPLNDNFHSRLNSGASSYSSSSEGAAFPSFDVRPEPFFHADGSVNVDSHNYSRLATPPREVGLIQPKSSFMHNGSCTQIPKLRIACSSGLNGSRTMWSHCEQCGAIEMLDPDY
ncbi:hypothetical protein PENSPDRAFT_484073 [Peniophora sp. CONT]|nr:hypothetical protein PENSPDRAFT_484073 [Peniophora sp. CONT]